VPAGAYTPADGRWLPAKGRFLVHVKPLATLFRGKVRAALQQLGWARAVPSVTWSTAWVVDCRAVGSGAAALTYLAPYVFRVALSNKRIVGVANDQVTFRYRDSATKKTKCATLPATEFIGRFLRHVLPRGFVKVRYFGLFRAGNRPLLAQIRMALAGPAPPCPIASAGTVMAADELPVPLVVRCPRCGAQMELTQLVQRTSRSPPPTRDVA
jgi:hypothetical protein